MRNIRTLIASAPLINHSTPCHIHGTSKTPYLDAHLHNSNTKAHIHALSVALADAVHGEGCTTCAVESAGQTLTSYLRDLRAAKKSGQWSSAEKRAIKAEVKGLMKGMKRDLRSIWKNKPQV